VGAILRASSKLSNLVANALRFTPRADKSRWSRKAGEGVRLIVRDTGLASRRAPRISDRF
jgi:signal transduction histidine kinase